MFDQQAINCCVSCALAVGMERVSPGSPTLAPLFHYYIARIEDAGGDPNGNLFLENALQTLAVSGICTHDLHPVPFTQVGSDTPPSKEARGDGEARALRRRAGRLRFEDGGGSGSNAAWIREKLDHDCPVILGIGLPSGYPDRFLDARYEWRDPDQPAPTDLGHCVLVSGYSDLRNALKIRDSRGSSKFDRGYWWMGYRVADSSAVQQLFSLLP